MPVAKRVTSAILLFFINIVEAFAGCCSRPKSSEQCSRCGKPETPTCCADRRSSTPTRAALHEFDEPTKLSRPINQYGDEMCITEMCMELHQNIGGVIPEVDARRQELCAFLKWKLANWQDPYSPATAGFDDAIRALVIAALDGVV